jgi:hypothetical protein
MSFSGWFAPIDAASIAGEIKRLKPASPPVRVFRLDQKQAA